MIVRAHPLRSAKQPLLLGPSAAAGPSAGPNEQLDVGQTPWQSPLYQSSLSKPLTVTQPRPPPPQRALSSSQGWRKQETTPSLPILELGQTPLTPTLIPSFTRPLASPRSGSRIPNPPSSASPSVTATGASFTVTPPPFTVTPPPFTMTPPPLTVPPPPSPHPGSDSVVLPPFTLTPPPLQVTLPSFTVTPPPLDLSAHRLATVTPPPLTLTPPPLVITPPPLVLTPPLLGPDSNAITVTLPPLTVAPPPLTVTPPPLIVTPPPL